MAIFNWTATNGQLYNQNVTSTQSSTLSPGDTIILSGDYNIINLAKVNGTPDKPITIIAESPVNVFGNGGYGIIIQGNHWKFIGNDYVKISPATFSEQGFGFGSSSNFEISGISIKNVKAGIFGNPSVGGIRENIKISDIFITNIITNMPIGQGTSEGIYFGNTSLQNTSVTGYNNVVFENIYMEGLDCDGLQIALTQNAIIRNVTIKNYGRKNVSGQKAGILIGGSSQALVENCHVESGTGAGMQIYGVNKTIIRNSNFINVAQGSSTDDSIYIEKKSNMVEPLSVEFDRVIIKGGLRNGIRNVNAVDILIKDCSISNTILAPTVGPNIRIETSPARPEPKVSVFSLYDDGTWVGNIPTPL